MGEIIRFVPKSERERARLIRGARAIYDSIFPSANVCGAAQRFSLGAPNPSNFPMDTIEISRLSRYSGAPYFFLSSRSHEAV